jgi:hypothetical protein
VVVFLIRIRYIINFSFIFPHNIRALLFDWFAYSWNFIQATYLFVLTFIKIPQIFRSYWMRFIQFFIQFILLIWIISKRKIWFMIWLITLHVITDVVAILILKYFIIYFVKSLLDVSKMWLVLLFVPFNLFICTVLLLFIISLLFIQFILIKYIIEIVTVIIDVDASNFKIKTCFNTFRFFNTLFTS